MSHTPESLEDTSSVKRASRKSHRKSRNGCVSCKERRVKCGEEKPTCVNCVKHASRCSFSRQMLPAPDSSGPAQNERLAPSMRPLLSRTPSSAAGHTSARSPASSDVSVPAVPSERRMSLNIADLELLHNYDTSTCYTLATIPALQTFLRLNVPRMAFSHPFLLHTVLAISAMHLAHFKRDLKTQYLMAAHSHYNIALSTATTLLEAISDNTCSALYVFSTLAPLFALGLGPTSGDFLIFSQQGIAKWLVLFRGLRTMIESHPGVVDNSDLSPMFTISMRQASQPPLLHNKHLQALHSLIVDSGADVRVYTTALEELAKSFPSPSPTSGHASPQTSPQIILIWLYRLSDDFLQRTQQRDPITLVILAHFCVLLNSLSAMWWINGWVEHLLAEIYASLDAEHRMWMSWPMEEIGWIPS